MQQKKIIVALDYAEAAAALALVDRLDPAACRLKVGKELFVSAGPGVVEALVGRGFDVFLDLKFHDIPNTVAQACRAAVKLGVWMINVHASGGEAMLRAAREAVAPATDQHAKLVDAPLSGERESGQHEVFVVDSFVSAIELQIAVKGECDRPVRSFFND